MAAKKLDDDMDAYWSKKEEGGDEAAPVAAVEGGEGMADGDEKPAAEETA